MKKIARLVSILFLLFPLTVKAQQPAQPDSLLNRLTGKWILTGTIEGKSTVHDVSVKRVLGGQYIELTETSREVDQKGSPQYEAIVYLCWEEPKKQYSCLWLDNTGNGGLSNGIVGRAGFDGDKIELVFKYNDNVQFHTTFAYNGKTGTWQWLMDGVEKGKTQPFARLSMTRTISTVR